MIYYAEKDETKVHVLGPLLCQEVKVDEAPNWGYPYNLKQNLGWVVPE